MPYGGDSSLESGDDRRGLGRGEEEIERKKKDLRSIAMV
jgi:hypothetical protein